MAHVNETATARLSDGMNMFVTAGWSYCFSEVLQHDNQRTLVRQHMRATSFISHFQPKGMVRDNREAPLGGMAAWRHGKWKDWQEKLIIRGWASHGN